MRFKMLKLWPLQARKDEIPVVEKVLQASLTFLTTPDRLTSSVLCSLAYMGHTDGP